MTLAFEHSTRQALRRRMWQTGSVAAAIVLLIGVAVATPSITGTSEKPVPINDGQTSPVPFRDGGQAAPDSDGDADEAIEEAAAFRLRSAEMTGDRTMMLSFETARVADGSAMRYAIFRYLTETLREWGQAENLGLFADRGAWQRWLANGGFAVVQLSAAGADSPYRTFVLPFPVYYSFYSQFEREADAAGEITERSPFGQWTGAYRMYNASSVDVPSEPMRMTLTITDGTESDAGGIEIRWSIWLAEHPTVGSISEGSVLLVPIEGEANAFTVETGVSSDEPKPIARRFGDTYTWINRHAESGMLAHYRIQRAGSQVSFEITNHARTEDSAMVTEPRFLQRAVLRSIVPPSGGETLPVDPTEPSDSADPAEPTNPPADEAEPEPVEPFQPAPERRR